MALIEFILVLPSPAIHFIMANKKAGFPSFRQPGCLLIVDC
jgi:hypothetical protein